MYDVIIPAQGEFGKRHPGQLGIGLSGFIVIWTQSHEHLSCRGAKSPKTLFKNSLGTKSQKNVVCSLHKCVKKEKNDFFASYSEHMAVRGGAGHPLFSRSLRHIWLPQVQVQYCYSSLLKGLSHDLLLMTYVNGQTGLNKRHARFFNFLRCP